MFMFAQSAGTDFTEKSLPLYFSISNPNWFKFSSDSNKIELSDLGLCDGVLVEDYCSICETVTYIDLNAYGCNWETVEETDTTWTQKCSICNAIVTEIYTDEGYTYIITVDGQEIYNKTVYYE